MKYLIPENKLHPIIYSFLDKELKEEGLVVMDGFDYTAEEYTDDLKWFYLRKFEGEVVFVEYITKNYFKAEEINTPNREEWYKKAPILEFRNDDMSFINKLNAFFGDYWKGVFKFWWKNNYPQYPVKTFIF